MRSQHVDRVIWFGHHVIYPSLPLEDSFQLFILQISIISNSYFQVMLNIRSRISEEGDGVNNQFAWPSLEQADQFCTNSLFSIVHCTQYQAPAWPQWRLD